MKPEVRILKEVNRHNHYFLVTHNDPDGDGLCALLGFYEFLQALGKEGLMYTPRPLPRGLQRLPKTQLIQHGRIAGLNADCLVVLDTPNQERIGCPKNLPIDFIINIDHHPSNKRFGDLNWVDIRSSSACELVYRLFRQAGLELNPQLAFVLYTGIYLETGGFSYPNTNSQSLTTAGALLKHGVEPADVARSFGTLTVSQLKLLARVIQKLEFKDGIAVIRLPYKMRSRLSDEPNANSFMQLPLFLDRVKVVIFLKEEKKGVVKVSFRSPGEVDVNELASRFGGGGHQTAAGARVPKSLSKVSQEVLRVTQAYLGSGGS